MVLALRSFLRIAAGDKLLFWDTSQAGENLANHLVDDLIQNVHSVAGLPGAIRLLAEFSVAGVANAERIVQSTIGELTPFPAGRQGEPCTTVAAVNVIGKQCLSTGTKRNMVFGFFRCVGRAIFPDTLCSFKLLLRDDLEFGHQFGAGISAAENAHVGQVADHSSQAARMPALSRAGTVSSIVQIGGNPLCAVTLVYIFIEDQPNDFGFLLVDMQFVEFVLALVDAATFHKVITIRRTAALEVSFFHKLPQAGTGTDRSFFAFAVCLPEADIVQQFVSVVVESLLTLLGTPFSSKTGNTKLLADTLHTCLPQESCCYFGTPDPAALEADELYVGFWTDKGTADESTSDFLKLLHGKNIFLFGTAGFGGSEEYFSKILKKAEHSLDRSNTVFGRYMCQGKMPLSVRQRYEGMKKQPIHLPNLDALIENFDNALSHPDADDLERLKQAVK